MLKQIRILTLYNTIIETIHTVIRYEKYIHINKIN